MGRRSSSFGRSGRASSGSRGGGGLFGSSTSSKSTPPPPPRSASPPSTYSAPPPAPSGGGGGLLGGFAGNVVSGIASGVGFSMASRAVDAVVGPRQLEVVHSNDNQQPQVMPMSQPPSGMTTPVVANTQNACQAQMEEFNQCMTRHTDLTMCQHYFDTLRQCQAGGMM